MAWNAPPLVRVTALVPKTAMETLAVPNRREPAPSMVTVPIPVASSPKTRDAFPKLYRPPAETLTVPVPSSAIMLFPLLIVRNPAVPLMLTVPLLPLFEPRAMLLAVSLLLMTCAVPPLLMIALLERARWVPY